jgi:hypothetical protein
MNDKDIERLSKQITSDPDLILEGIEGDLGYFMIHGHLSSKESNFQVGVNTEDDPGDYPNAVAAEPKRSYRFVEEIYGGAELRLDISVDEVPPYMNWRIEHEQASIGRYKQENGNIISYRENRPVGVLVFSNNDGVVAADVQFMNEALEMQLYAVRDELDIDIPLDVMEDLSWHLEITWVNWEFKEGKLGCTIGVEAVVE